MKKQLKLLGYTASQAPVYVDASKDDIDNHDHFHFHTVGRHPQIDIQIDNVKQGEAKPVTLLIESEALELRDFLNFVYPGNYPESRY